MEKMNGGFASEPKDLVIKLFGKTIPVPGSHLPSTSDDKSDDLSSDITETVAKDSSFEKSKNHDQPYIDEGVKEESSLVTDDGDRAQANIKMKVYEEKVLKKPDKVLSCPRCNSFDTKFCYFNNYNVNQPRHFCRQCQRYWTAGGAMRNVPIGAGKRKHKYFASQYGHFSVPLGTLQANLNIVSRDGKLLKFNSESGICQSIETVENEMADPVSLQNFPVPPVFPQNQVHSLVPKAEARWPYKVNRNPIRWGKKKVVSGPSPPDISLQFVPALLWGCVPVTRHMPIGVSDGGLSQSSCASNSCLDNNSPNLGKIQKWGLLDDSLLLNEKESESSSGILRP